MTHLAQGACHNVNDIPQFGFSCLPKDASPHICKGKKMKQTDLG